MRHAGVLYDLLPLKMPITPNHLLNVYLKEELDKREREYRLGTVFTTANRNWEFIKARTVSQIHVSRSVAIDMESATIATDRKSTRLNSSHVAISYAVFCLKQKTTHHGRQTTS